MKRCFIAILICLTFCTLFSGCGGDSGKTSDTLTEDQIQAITKSINEEINFIGDMSERYNLVYSDFKHESDDYNRYIVSYHYQYEDSKRELQSGDAVVYFRWDTKTEKYYYTKTNIKFPLDIYTMEELFEQVKQSETFGWGCDPDKVEDMPADPDDDIPPEEAPPEIQDTFDDWKGAYDKVLNEMKGNYTNYQYLCSYSVYDIDNNDVPELLIKVGTCEADFEYRLFNYDTQLSVAMCFHTMSGSHTYPCGLSNSGAVLFVGGHQGYESVTKVTYDGISCTEELLFSTEVQEYHDFSYLDCFELDDTTGLQWTTNPPDDNASILNGLESTPSTSDPSIPLGEASIEILSVDYTGDPMYPLNVTYRINNVPKVRGCVYLSCDAHAYSTQMFFFDENHINEYREGGIYDYRVGWSGEGMTNYFNIYYGYGSFDPNVGWSNSCACKIYYRLIDDYGTISNEAIPEKEIIRIYDGEQEVGAWTLHASGDLIEVGGNSTATPFAKNARFASSSGHIMTVSIIDGIPRFSVDGVEIGSPRAEPIEIGTGTLFYEIDAPNGTYTISRFPNDEYITVNVMGNISDGIAGDYFPE